MSTFYKKLKNRNSRWKFNLLKPFLMDGETILDVGCGDMGLSQQIVAWSKKTTIQGVDVIPLKRGIKSKRLRFQQYDGKRIPFSDNSFDTVLLFYVLHHCQSPKKVLEECMRIARKRIIIIESIPQSRYELPFMKFLDWFFNIIKFDTTPLPYNFLNLKKISQIFKKTDFKNTITFHPKGLEDYLPIGKLYFLEFRK